MSESGRTGDRSWNEKEAIVHIEFMQFEFDSQGRKQQTTQKVVAELLARKIPYVDKEYTRTTQQVLAKDESATIKLVKDGHGKTQAHSFLELQAPF